MSEMQELEKEARRQYTEQRLHEVAAYVSSLCDEIQEKITMNRRADLIYLAGWLVWLASDFVKLSYIGVFAFIIGLIYSAYTERKLSRAFGEFYGAIKILEILGLAEVDDINRAKRKRGVMQEMVSMVKGWATKKKEAQEKVYAPV